MAGNTRGKLKEEFEGIHRNFDWIEVHCERSLKMIKAHNPKLTGVVKQLHKACSGLDILAQKIYSAL